MLKNKARGQNRKRLAIDGLGIQGDYRDTEEISDGSKKPLLIYFAGVEHLHSPGATIQILRELGCFLVRFHPARHQKIDDRFVDCRAHLSVVAAVYDRWGVQQSAVIDRRYRSHWLRAHGQIR